jgi:hypothetical protein
MLKAAGYVGAGHEVKQNTPQKEVTQRNLMSQINTQA